MTQLLRRTRWTPSTDGPTTAGTWGSAWTREGLATPEITEDLEVEEEEVVEVVEEEEGVEEVVGEGVGVAAGKLFFCLNNA